ncbi:alkyl hydroperoxide reductase [Gemmata sp. G18]|uniref:Alkyl hydroperoxide reductase n=1 Tax=Gemmata palustris TaxID=2822762 RepID=A0ABS5BKW0_9BACT|nr:alkyl hydroperoxide reductase [Gemmata palustris]MBP3954329.1 alkyl hydroperoxide reductase [Gemmata palustris]
MPRRAPKWMYFVLILAGVYNLAWGAWAVLFPTLSFANSGMRDPDKPLYYPQLWQCIGMIVGVYGVAYILAARDPARHWPVILVGLLGKLFGPVGLAFGVATGQARPEGLITCLTNDLIWWVPFVLILWYAYRESHVSEATHPSP